MSSQPNPVHDQMNHPVIQFEGHNVSQLSELRYRVGVYVPAIDGPVPVRRRPFPAGRRRAGRAQGHPHGEVRHDERHVRAQGRTKKNLRGIEQ